MSLKLIVLSTIGLIILFAVIWQWKLIKQKVKEKIKSMSGPFVEMYSKHPFAASMMIGVFMFAAMGFFTYSGHKISIWEGYIYDLSKVGLSVIFVTILLSADRFVPVVKKALGEFFTEKEYLDTLKPQELQKLVHTINESTNNHYKFEDTKRKEDSIILAREKALEENMPHFVRDSTVIKVIYEKGLEMTVVRSEVEMLKDGPFLSKHSIMVEEDEAIILPEMKKFLAGTNRFKQYVFRAKITEYNNGRHGGDPTGFALFDLNVKKTHKFNPTEEEIFKKNVLVDEDKQKFLILETKGEFRRGDTFTYESITSIPRAQIEGNSMPGVTFSKPAGVRRVIAQSQHFITPDNDGINGGTLTIGGVTANDDCVPSEDIFYKKYEWTLYYDEVSTHEDQKVQLKLN